MSIWQKILFVFKHGKAIESLIKKGQDELDHIGLMRTGTTYNYVNVINRSYMGPIIVLIIVTIAEL